MGEQYYYLAINIAAISVPFFYSFEKKLNFKSQWKYVFPAIIFTALPFILWDIWFTEIGVWGFNPRYLSGIYLFNLPLEEILFFLCIPYACLFTYAALEHFLGSHIFSKVADKISYTLIGTLLLLGLVYFEKAYTALTFIGTALFILSQFLISNTRIKGHFYFSYLIILLPFFIVNGILTGSGIEDQIVWYNNAENLGIRLGTIPLEDIFYGMLLILMNVQAYEYLKGKY